MEKPIKDWTLEELRKYCDDRGCYDCVFNDCPSGFECSFLSDEAFWEWLDKIPSQEPPKVSSQPNVKETSLGEMTLNEVKKICRTSHCAECAFLGGKGCNILRKPERWILAQKPLVFTETEKAIAKSLAYLTPFIQNIELYRSTSSNTSNTIYVRNISWDSTYPFAFPISLFPTITENNLQSVTLADILKEEGNE